MTTRRSRLKAVANLPVRRKIPAFEGGADTNSSLDNFASSNGTPSNVKNDVSNTQNDVGSSYEFKKTIYVTAPENKSISGSNYENNTNNKNKVANCEDNIQQNPIAEPSVQVENNLDSFRETEEIQKSNKSNEACLTSNNSCNNSSPYECNRTHEENLVSSIPRQENPNFLMQTSVASDILRTENNNIKETLDSFALDSNSILKTSMPAMSIPLTSYANTDPTATVTNSNAQNSNNDFNGLQIYSNLVEPTDLYVNMPKLVSSETTDNTDFLDSEESGPILTTLLNCSAQCDFNNINKIANYKERNLMPSEKNTQELFLNDTCKNTGVIEVINYSESDGVSRNIINPDRDKVLGDNLVYHSSQDHNQLNSASSTNISRRNIATVKRKRSKCSDFTKKLADARREFQKKYEKTKPDRSTLKMIDLIFYNPATNPME